MESSERIASVVFSVWGTEAGLIKRGREGILILTNRRVAFVSKTKMSKNLWQSEVDKQLKSFRSSKDIMKVPGRYTLEILQKDIISEENMTIPLSEVVNAESEEKDWGTELRLKFMKDGKPRGYKFAVVKSWVKYPVNDPIAFLAPDWRKWIVSANSYKGQL